MRWMMQCFPLVVLVRLPFFVVCTLGRRDDQTMMSISRASVSVVADASCDAWRRLQGEREKERERDIRWKARTGAFGGVWIFLSLTFSRRACTRKKTREEEMKGVVVSFHCAYATI